MGQPAIGIEVFHPLDIVGEGGRKIVAPPKAADALAEFPEFRRLDATQVVAARTGMGVYDPVRALLAVQVGEEAKEDEVLEDVGVVAGVEPVAVAEHGPGFYPGSGSRAKSSMRGWRSRGAPTAYWILRSASRRVTDWPLLRQPGRARMPATLA